MFISYEELKLMEEKYREEVRSAKAHLDVICELIKIAEDKEPVKTCSEIENEPEVVTEVEENEPVVSIS